MEAVYPHTQIQLCIVHLVHNRLWYVTWKGRKAIVPNWERNWERLTPFFIYPPEIRKVVYTTNAI